MTKKDFIKAAGLISNFRLKSGYNKISSYSLNDLANIIEDMFVEFFRGTNDRFDEGRFRKACQLKDK